MLRIRTETAMAAAVALLLAFAPVKGLLAQAGDRRDKPGVVQREVWRQIDTPAAPPLSPEEALRSFDIEPGFRLELVASEPLINDPVAIAWDADGRLWAAEFWSYMPDPDGTGEDEPRGRIVVLEDLDQDGRMDRSTVFLDNLVLPRALAFVRGGLLVADPPYLYFCEDLDGDLVSDRQTRLTEYARTGNVEHAENGLLRALDNWLYNAKSDRRFRFGAEGLVEDKTLFRGQWGIAQDNFGRLYYNHNSYPLYADALPYDSIDRHPGWEPKAGFAHEVSPNAELYPARVNPGINRAYIEGWLAPDHRLRRADAASAPTIYRGHRYPAAYQGDAFVPDPSGNLVATYRLRDDGLRVYGAQRLHHSPEWAAVSFIASSDERFRPVAAATGPDGYLYIVDMYRGIIQHKTFLTTFLRKQIIERGLDDPVGLGRIYRLVHESDPSDRSFPLLSKVSEAELVAHLGSANGWVRDTAQRLLVDSGGTSEETLEALRRMASEGSELARIHALWTLEGRGALDADTLLRALVQATPWVQAHLWQAGAATLASAAASHPIWERYREALRSSEGRVQLHALHQLPLLPDPDDRIATLLQYPDSRYRDPYFIDASISALTGLESAFLAAAEDAEQEASPGLVALVESLAEAAYAAERHNVLIRETAEADSGWPQQVFRERIQSLLEKEPSPAFAQYHASEIALIEAGRPLYQNVCAACHQEDGKGVAGLAPPLAGSEWVTGSKERLALVVAHGLEGPIQVLGQDWDSVMPGHGQHPMLQGEAFAAVLSYIRAAWGHEASVISPAEAEELLAPHADRSMPWTAEELPAR